MKNKLLAKLTNPYFFLWDGVIFCDFTFFFIIRLDNTFTFI